MEEQIRSGTNRQSVVAVACGFVGVAVGRWQLLFVIALLLGALGLVFGILGVRRAREIEEGKGRAIAGIVLSCAAIALGVAGALYMADIFEGLDRMFMDIDRRLDGMRPL